MSATLIVTGSARAKRCAKSACLDEVWKLDVCTLPVSELTVESCYRFGRVGSEERETRHAKPGVAPEWLRLPAEPPRLGHAAGSGARGVELTPFLEYGRKQLIAIGTQLKLITWSRAGFLSGRVGIASLECQHSA